MLSFANSTGSLYNRIGAVASLLKEVKTYQGSQQTNMIDTTLGVVAQLNAESDIQATMGSQYISLLNSSSSPIGSFCQQISAQIVNRMIFRDNPRLSQNLQSLNTLASLQEVIRQMVVAGASVLAQTISLTPTAFTGQGNGVIVGSSKRPFDGLILENAYAENILFVCSQDSYTGGATAGNESFQVTGAGSAGLFDFDWPLGSNAQTSLTAIDGSQDNNGGNLLTNSDFQDFTTNTPDHWEIVTGTAGTNITKQTGIVYTGTSSLGITGDGSGTLTQIRQAFNNSTSGTAGNPDPETQYSFNLFIRRDGVAPGAGKLAIELTDSAGAVINDTNGVANSYEIDLTTLNTTFTAYNVAFRTPTETAAGYIRYRLTTALTNGRTVYIGKSSLGEMTQFYTHGPFLAVHSGSTPFLFNDFATMAVTNSRGAAGTLSTFQTYFFRAFPDMVSSELLLPSSSSPTISDSII